MAIQDQITAYKAQVNNDVSTQSDPNSIAPDAVGSIGTDLADIILPELLKINNFNTTGGTAMPNGGQPNDLYFKSNLNEIQIYKNINGVWTLKSSIPLGVSYPDGILLGLRVSLNGYIATVTAGSWSIANTPYSKTTQTQFTLDPKDINYGRWDLIYANAGNQVLLVKGVASNVPAKPALPANSILVDYVYIPSVGLPYTQSGSINAGVIAEISEQINFDFAVTPITTIDMTGNDRDRFGPNPHIEVWNTNGNIETLIDPGTIQKVKTAGVLTAINIPDLNFDFAPTKTGYFLIYK